MFDPALKLGTTVVKTALKLWMGDVPFAADVGATATDLLGKRVTDAMDRRKLQRRFDDFGDTIAQRVIDQLGQEFSGLPDNEREAAVLAVTGAFERAELTDGSLFDQDLDALHLELRIRQASPQATRDLSEAATGVYDRLLPECCAYAIATTTSLPTFNADAFTELLRRDTLILERLDQILRHLPTPSASDGEGKEAQFATAFRRKAAERWDRLELFGTNTQTRTYPLSLAYLSLNVTLPEYAWKPDEGRHEWGQDKRSTGLQSAEAALAGNPRVFLRGAAGSGKTTLLHWIAVRASRGDFPPALADWNGLIPFFLPLRRYVGERLPEHDEFIRPTGSYLQKEAPDGWVERLLEEGRALLLIDGVDELPKDEREAARRWLRALLDEFPRCRYVVTSRPAAVSEGWLSHQDFASAEVQPLRDEDVRAFITYWHRAVRSEVVDEDEQVRLERYESELTAKVLGQRHLRNIASTPLLCALLCALYRDRRTALPRDRIEVYQAALAMLLTDRDEQRGIPADGPDMSLTEKTQLLQELAKWLILNGSSDAPKDTAQRQIGRLLAIMHRVDGDAEEVFDHLMLRSGVLTSPAVDRVAFVHRTFEEYLAARALVEEDSLPLLIKHAHDDQWHEVVVMAAGHAGQRQREELIRGLLERADRVKKHHDRLQIVALACLATSTSLSAELRSDIERRVRSLLPPRTDAQVKAIITAGEVAIPFLEEARALDARSATATIRAAAGIAAEESSSIIANAFQSLKPTSMMVASVLDAWEANPTRRFAELVLPHYPMDAMYLFSTPGDKLDIVAPNASHLKAILVNGNQETDLGHLRRMDNLVQLVLASDKIPWKIDLNPVGDCLGQFKSISTTGRATLADASPLHRHPLQHLCLSAPEHTDNLEVLKESPELSSLVLEGDLPRLPVSDVAPPHLNSLTIRSNKEISSIKHFINLDGVEVERLRFFHTPNLRTILGIEDLGIPLREFQMYGPISTGSVDLTPLTHIATLRNVNLGFSILQQNKGPLTSIHQLNELIIHVDIRQRKPILFPHWLKNIPHLRRIRVTGNQPLDLSLISGIENVTLELPHRSFKKTIGADKLGPGSAAVCTPRPKY
ncbi:NACHT domain-containing protein [Nocardiopsis chromatogenes]|uniref:NACHT domain-containing protein n=1 Tax=Nocardiopsis chromatogenes TaxID=280239 RepID=UPI00034B8F95|nr:NACHT domain-containing protein [Nocardiopsis chromatogenes]